MSALTWPLRLLAIAGPVAVLLWQVVSLPPLLPRQDVGFVALFVLAFVVGLWLALMRASRTILRHGDVLVPLGLYVTAVPLANAVLALPALAAVTAPSWSAQVLGLGLSLSAGLVVQIVLAVFHGGWTTLLVVQAAQQGRTNLVGALARPWRWFGRVFVAETIGWGGLFGLMIPALAVASVALPLALLLIGVISLVWNLVTAAVLPVVVASRRPLGAALADGFRASRRAMGRLWFVVVVQMLLLGWVTFLFASFTTSNGPGNVTTKNSTNWSVNGFWTGGYEDNSRWYGKVTEIYETQPLAPVTTLLGLLFGVLAIAVKVRVATDLWPEPEPDQEEADERRAAPRPGCTAAAFLMIVLLVVGLGLALAFRQTLADELLLWQMHRAANRGEPLEPFVQQARQHEGAVDFAARLGADADPRVRREAIALLVADATPARKVERRFGVVGETWTGMNTRGIPALTRLLADPDPEVRHHSLRTASGLKSNEDFRQPLLRALRAGDREDQIIVAESLAHWDPDEFLTTLADPAQSREVRLAVLRGAEKYGWGRVADREDKFAEALKRVSDDPDDELRRAAIGAARYGRPEAAVPMWLGVIGGKRPEDRRLAFDTWVDAVVNDDSFPGENYPTLEATENQQFAGNMNEAAAARMALVTHVVCAAARVNTRELDRAAPVNWQQALAERDRGGPAAVAFVVELHRLQQVLRAIVVARFYARFYPQLRFTAWLPDEKADGPPPTRVLKDYLLAEAREPLTWCRNHGGGYASPFLRVNGFRREGEDPGRGGRVRTLGQVLKDTRLDTDAALTASLKADNGP
jgi:hypothetical protein